MKWIKASERLPLKMFGTIARFAHTKTILFDFIEWVRQNPEKLTIIEWLDESESPSLQELQAKANAFDLLENLLTRNRSIEIAEYRNEDGEVIDYGVITDTKEFLAPTLSEAIEKASKK